VLLPHMGSATIEGRIAMGERVIINIKTFADGHRPPGLSARCCNWAHLCSAARNAPHKEQSLAVTSGSRRILYFSLFQRSGRCTCV
jgi:hypothetical protein